MKRGLNLGCWKHYKNHPEANDKLKLHGSGQLPIPIPYEFVRYSLGMGGGGEGMPGKTYVYNIESFFQASLSQLLKLRINREDLS